MIYSIQIDGSSNIKYFISKNDFIEETTSLLKDNINFRIKLILNNEYVCSKCNTDVVVENNKKLFLCKCKNAKVFAVMGANAKGTSTCGLG